MGRVYLRWRPHFRPSHRWNFGSDLRLAQRDFPETIAASEGVAMDSGVAYFGFMAGPPIIGFLSSLIDLRWAMMAPGVLALVLGFSARKVVSN